MGRSIRKVPIGWEHPRERCEHSCGGCPDSKRNGGKCKIPMYDETYADARQRWLDGLAAHSPAKCNGQDYWEYDGNPPERKFYRPWKDEDAVWFQLWETVSEGTPITPPFATLEELSWHLQRKGTEWDKTPWSKESADAFVRSGWAPSFMSTPDAGIIESKDIPAYLEKNK